MFGIPIEKIEFADIDAFCRSGIREGILLDFKKDFPARLEKAIAAFANTYGGFVLIGIDETSTNSPVTPIHGVALGSGLRERVIQVAINAIYPPVIPEVKVVEFKSRPDLKANDRAVVVIRVHESDVGSHAVDGRTTVYLRVDNVSDPYRKATVDELEWFANKRGRALAEKNRVIGIAQEHSRNYLIRLRAQHQLPTTHPRARFAFWTVPTFPHGPVASPQEFLKICPSLSIFLPSHRHILPLGSVLPITGGIYFDGDYRSDYRYTEVQQQGLVYHEYGFWWDDEDRWRGWVFPNAVAELLLASLAFGARLYQRVGYWGLVDVEFRLVGVRGRKFGAPNSMSMSQHIALDDIVAVQARETVSLLSADTSKIAKALYQEILWGFGWAADTSVIDRHFSGLEIQA